MISGANIFGKLTSISGIAALVSNRIYPQYNRAADKQYPLIIYKVENQTTDAYYTGGTSGLEKADLVLACISITHAGADALATAVQLAIDDDTSAWGSTTMQDCSLKDDGITDDVVTNEETEEILFYVKELSFSLIFNN
jgi:hypothetical protein